MQVINLLTSWAFNCGFKDHSKGLFRACVNSCYRESVSQSLKSMGLTLTSTTAGGTDIWVSEDDTQVVLVKYS